MQVRLEEHLEPQVRLHLVALTPDRSFAKPGAEDPATPHQVSQDTETVI